MSATPEVEVRPAEQVPDDPDDLIHTYCRYCGPDRALCGTDLTGAREIEPWEQGPLCIVCDDLYDRPCLVCGRRRVDA